MRGWSVWAMVLGGLLGALALGQAPVSAPLPEGEGLAAKYPGDQGIQQDPDVVFAEDFENGTLEEIAKRWGNISNKGGRSWPSAATPLQAAAVGVPSR